jgi:hypothetical protein
MGLLLIALLPALPAPGLAQGGTEGAQDRDSIEPGVATSGAARPPSATPPPNTTPTPANASAKASSKASSKPPPKAASGDASKVAGTPPSTTAASAPPATPGKAGKASDRLELDPTQISGNRELPRVMYVVPWRRPDLGEFAGRPPNSLLDEALTPVDRDVFRRQNSYYAALQLDAAPAAHEDEK